MLGWKREGGCKGNKERGREKLRSKEGDQAEMAAIESDGASVRARDKEVWIQMAKDLIQEDYHHW